jgi:hypothetical protein
VGGLVRIVGVLALLGLPLVVITALPSFFELAGSVPVLRTGGQAASGLATPVYRLSNPQPTNARARFAPVVETPPPTLAAPAAQATLVATPRPTPTGERIVIGNTDGIGAVLRSEPVTGQALAALPEQLVLEVLERRSIAGSGEWVHVRTPEGRDGWVTGLVALPVPLANH